jgi:lipopolysaccharide export system protein LptA
VRGAARDARWAAAAAIVLVAIVAASYFERAWRASREQRNVPPAIPPSVEQRSAEFAFSKVEGNHTLFTVRASRTTEYKEQNRSLLEDVWITIYGHSGERNDNIHTRECSYEATSGRIVCQGEVQLDLAGAAGAAGPGRGVVHLETRNVSFDRNAGIATTPAAVRFSFPAGKGRATGLTYDTRDATITLRHDVQLVFSKASSSSAPVTVRAGALAYRRRENLVMLSRPVQAQQGWRELTAGSLEVTVDPELHPERATAAGGPEILSEEKRGWVAIRANRFLASFKAGGELDRLVGEGEVRASRAAAAARDKLEGDRAEITFAGNHQPQRMLVTGAVRAQSEGAGRQSKLATSALEIEFTPAANPRARRGGQASEIRRAETPAAGTLAWKTPTEALRVQAGQLAAEFDGRGQVRALRGAGGTRIERQAGSEPPIESASNQFTMEFAKGEWRAIEQAGQVALRQGPAAAGPGQGGRTASADRARFVRSSETAVLTGNATMSDAESRTQAERILFDQAHNEIRAEGNVCTSYFSRSASAKPAGLGQGPALVAAAELVANAKSGQAEYSGGARFWQDDATVQADALTLTRTPEEMEARGHVSGTFLEAAARQGSPSRGGVARLWRVRAGKLLYRGDEGRAWLTGGASATAEDAQLSAPEITLFFERSGSGPARLARASATGGAMLRQGDRWATGSRADYAAADDKIVFTGGPPALHDASGNLVTGRQLTLFLANDTILVDSDQGGRTLAKYRIAK